MNFPLYFDIFIIILILIIILGVSVLIIYNIDKSIEKYGNMDIPSKIWTYWEGGNIPITVQKCIKTWQKFNPNYEITMLNDAIFKELCGIDIKSIKINQAFIPRKADFIRIIVLEKFGGVWMDSSIICRRPLDLFIPMKYNFEFIGYKSPHATNEDYPIIENWFFAAPPGSKIIKEWLKESLYMTTFETEKMYISQLKNVDLQNLKEHLPYLTMHVTLAVALQHNYRESKVNDKEKKYNLKLYPSITSKGPFQYLSDVDWDTQTALEKVCSGKIDQPLIKLRGFEREYLETEDLDCEF